MLVIFFFRNVDDIDLFPGGMSEPIFDGGLAGETFSFLMGLQFQRLKYGDRFFYDNVHYPTAYSTRKYILYDLQDNKSAP